jgi:hypothetical protein
MIIEKEFVLKIDDIIHFYDYNSKKFRMNVFVNIIDKIIFFAPVYFILYLIYSYLFGETFRNVGIGMLIVFIFLVRYIILMSLNNRNNRKKHLLKTYHFTNNENILFSLNPDENYFIYDDNLYKSKIYKDWIIDCTAYKEYIFIIGRKSSGLILPKFIFTEEEQKIIFHYCKNK